MILPEIVLFTSFFMRGLSCKAGSLCRNDQAHTLEDILTLSVLPPDTRDPASPCSRLERCGTGAGSGRCARCYAAATDASSASAQGELEIAVPDDIAEMEAAVRVREVQLRAREAQLLPPLGVAAAAHGTSIATAEQRQSVRVWAHLHSVLSLGLGSMARLS